MKYLFVDMDGVIAEYGYPSGLYDGDFQKGNYLGKRPVNILIDTIITRYNNPDHIVMVCSASPNSKATLEKNEWLNRFFNVPYENRLFIGKDEDKVETIRSYIEDIMHGNVQEHCIIIDDKGSTLAKAHSLGIECYHPTQLLALVASEQPIEQSVEEPVENIETDNIETDNIETDNIETDNIETVDQEVFEGEQMTFDDLQTLSEIEEVKEEE